MIGRSSLVRVVKEPYWESSKGSLRSKVVGGNNCQIMLQKIGLFVGFLGGCKNFSTLINSLSRIGKNE